MQPRFPVAALFVCLFTAPLLADCVTPTFVASASVDMGTLRIREHQLSDFNGDGRVDIAAVAYAGSEPLPTRVIVSLQQENGAFAPPVVVRQTAVSMIRAGDVTGDGRADLFFTTQDTDELITLPGNGDGTFGAAIVTKVDETQGPATAADVNGDGNVDMVVMQGLLLKFAIFAGDGTGRFALLSEFAHPPGATSITLEDIDLDGDLDLFTGRFERGVFQLRYGNGDGTFGPMIETPTQGWTSDFAIADLDGDGDRDFVTTNYSDYSVTIWTNDGGQFTPVVVSVRDATRFPLPTALVIADLNGDSRLDIAAGAFSTKFVVLAHNADGTYTPKIWECPQCTSQGFAAADVDRDGRLDLIPATLRTYRNVCGDSRVLLQDDIKTIAAGTNLRIQAGVMRPADPHAMFAAVVPQPTGTIELREGNTVVATGAAPNPILTVPNLARGTHTFVARYNGDAEYEPSESQPVTITVTGINANLVLAQSEPTSVYGKPVTIEALINAGSGGSLTITVGGDAQTFAGTNATRTITPLPGMHAITASFSGNDFYEAATSPELRHVVTPATPTITATPAGAAGAGQLASFNVSLRAPFTGTPSGSVQLVRNGVVVTTAAIDAAGNAVLRTASLPSGTHALTARYDGDGRFASVQTTFSFTVAPGPKKRRPTR
jgi:hypothetical protein